MQRAQVQLRCTRRIQCGARATDGLSSRRLDTLGVAPVQSLASMLRTVRSHPASAAAKSPSFTTSGSWVLGFQPQA